MSNWETVREFENKVAAFFGAPFSVAVDSCTHGLELCLRYTETKQIDVPRRTYLSVAMLAEKLRIERIWTEENWKDYYYLTPTIIDAAVLWKPKSYIQSTFMSLSFQYQKHLSIGRSGMILCDSQDAATMLKKMSYDGRVPGIPWRSQNIDTMGFHYYCTPEMAALGLGKLDDAILRTPRQWTIEDWPDISQLKIFN